MMPEVWAENSWESTVNGFKEYRCVAWGADDNVEDGQREHEEGTSGSRE